MTLKLIDRADLGQYLNGAKKIVDIGCGNKPFKAATVIVDKLPDKYDHNGKTYTENPKGMIKTLPGVEFVEADLRDLPFKDNEFDFAFCSHVIEHVDDLGQALQSLSRIAPRGYLECPRYWFEYVDTTPFHKWFIDFDGEQLIAKPKSEFERQYFLNRRIFDHENKLFNKLYRSYEANFINDVDSEKNSNKLRFKLRRMLSPKQYPSLEQQQENKRMVALTLYWERDIPFTILKPSVYKPN